MKRTRELAEAPGLIDPQCQDRVDKDLAAIVVGPAADRERDGPAPAGERAEVDCGAAPAARRPARILKRNRARQAGTELVRVAEAENADLVRMVGGARIYDGVGVGGDDVEERSNAARREPRELNE